MIDATDVEKTFSYSEEEDGHEPVQFDPECTFVDEEFETDSDTLAFRDAVRDIWAAEGSFELILAP